MRGLLLRSSGGRMVRALLSLSVLCALSVNSASAQSRDPVAETQPSASSTSSISTTVLELSSVLQSVDRAFPLLRAAQQERSVAEAQSQTAHGGFDPVARLRGAMTPTGPYTYGYFDATVEQPTPLWGASFFVGYRYGQAMAPWGSGTSEIPVYDGRLQTNEAGEVRAGVTVPLWRDGAIDRRRAEIARTDLGLRVADLTIAQQRLEYQRVAALRYWDWVFSGARLRVAEQLLSLAQMRDVEMAQRAVSGDIPPMERTDNARTVQSRIATVAVARRALEQASIELSLYLRDASGNPVIPSPSQLPPRAPEPQDPSSIIQQSAAIVGRALENRPEIPRLAAQREQSDVELRLARNQVAPAINLSLTVAQDIGSQSSTRARTEVTGGIVLDVPIPNRAGQGRVRSAEASVTRIQEQFRFAQDRVAADVRDAISALQAASLRAQAAVTEASLALEVENGERDKFHEGDTNVLLLNLREIATAEARLRVLEAHADFQRALVMLRAAEGRISER